MTTLADRPEFRALVVDDDPIVRRMVTFALEQEGFTCDAATDGVQATGLLKNRPYHLLVTDLRMPNKHGHALAVDVLAGESRPRIMVHTSVDDPRLTKDLILRGVDDVVYKPTNYAAFAAKARGMLMRDRELRIGPPRVDRPAEKPEPTSSAPRDEAELAEDVPVRLPEMKRKLADVSKVRPVSQTALDVSNMVRSNSFNAEQVAAAVQRDAGLAARVVQLANNPFYNATGKQITDVKQAVTRIGQKRIGEFALATSALAAVSPETLPWMDQDLAWRRSVAAGIAVELLMKQGGHARISEGLLFSALMHSSGRIVLGTHFPKRYEAMVNKCAEDHEPLLQHEALAFPASHAEVACGVLADWNIPADVYGPLREICKDYQSLSRLPEPARTKAELVKLAILLGQIAVGRWEPWDLIEIPPRQVLDRLRIDAVGTIIEQTEVQLRGIASFRTSSSSQTAAGQESQPSSDSRQLSYCNLSKGSYDFLAEIVPSMGIGLSPVEFKPDQLHGNVLVNRLGVAAEIATARTFARARCKQVVFVRDADKMSKCQQC